MTKGKDAAAADESSQSGGHRPWYRLYPASWFMMAVVALPLLVLQLPFESSMNPEGLGWPVVAVYRPNWTKAAAMRLLNLTVGVLVLAATGFVVERWSRQKNQALLSLSSVMLSVTAIAVLLGCWKLDSIDSLGDRISRFGVIYEVSVTAYFLDPPLRTFLFVGFGA